jgi:hypothetical protein
MFSSHCWISQTQGHTLLHIAITQYSTKQPYTHHSLHATYNYAFLLHKKHTQLLACTSNISPTLAMSTGYSRLVLTNICFIEVLHPSPQDEL